jgi:hypothetical protein
MGAWTRLPLVCVGFPFRRGSLAPIPRPHRVILTSAFRQPRFQSFAELLSVPSLFD